MRRQEALAGLVLSPALPQWCASQCPGPSHEGRLGLGLGGYRRPIFSLVLEARGPGCSQAPPPRALGVCVPDERGEAF